MYTGCVLRIASYIYIIGLDACGKTFGCNGALRLVETMLLVFCIVLI
jgi:hypothetical protein